VYCRTTKRFLFLRELTDKPRVFKIKGMLAFPSETREGCDTSVRATITRLIYEEVGVELLGDILLSIEPLTDFMHGIPIYISWVVVSKEFTATPNDTDVEHGIWLTKSKVVTMNDQTDFFRIETLPVLQQVLALGKSALI